MMSVPIVILSFVIGAYCISILLLTLGFQIQKTSVKELKKSKNISVVIAVRNEELNIRKCLNSLLNQKYEKDNYEIIIIDDHSTDNSVDIINDFIKENKNIRLIRLSETSSKKEAIKKGVENSKFDVIATTDADSIVPETWLKMIGNSMETDNRMLIGPINFIEKEGFLNAFQQLDLFALQGLTFGSLFYQKPTICSGVNLAFLKSDFIEHASSITQKNPSGDDVFLLEQFYKYKKKIAGCLNRDFVVNTNSENSITDFINQRKRWASKSKYYQGHLLKFFCVLIFFANLTMIFIYFGVVFIDKNMGFYIILLICKWLVDFILLFLVSAFFYKQKKMIYFIPAQLLYPFYILITGIISFNTEFSWKGRVYNG